MSLYSELRHRAQRLFNTRREDAATHDELAHHLEMLTRELQAQGHSPSEARRLASVTLGNRAATEEAVRDARGNRTLEDAVRDIRFAARQLIARPAFSASVLVTLALGVGATTAIISVADHVLLRPAPFESPDQLVMMWGTDTASGTTREPQSWPDLVDLRAQSTTLAGVAGVIASQGNVRIQQGDPQRRTVAAVTSNYLSLVGIRPISGRSFDEADDAPGGAPIAAISESLWRTAFNASPTVVGSTFEVDDVAVEIVAVIPDHADYALDQINARAAYHAPYIPDGSVDVWMPIRASADQFPRSTHPFLVLARTVPGAIIGSVQREATAIASGLEQAYSENAARGLFVESLDDVVLSPIRPLISVLLVAAVLLLLVATANIANLLLARAAQRNSETALRAALGASARRILRQFITEGVLLVTLGAAAGVGLASLALGLVRSYGPADVPRLASVAIDGRVLVIAIGIALVIGVAFGLVPALASTRRDPIAVLRAAAGGVSLSPGTRRLRDVLVAVQLTLCVALGVSAVLLGRSFMRVLAVDAGFSAERVLKAEYQLPLTRYPRDFSRFPRLDEIHQFSNRLLTQLRAIPGVESAAIAANHPLDAGFTNSWQVVGRESEAGGWPEISIRVVSAGYAETMGLVLRSGRGFSGSDDVSAPAVALINETAATRFFSGQDPVGQRLQWWGIERQIVGVVRDERIHGLTTAAPPAAYAPLGQIPMNNGVVLIKTRGTPLALAGEVRRAVATVDPQLAVYGVEPMQETLDRSVAERKFALMVMAAFALVTILLALIGVYGVVSYAAAQRSREIGIRQALGAAPASAVLLVLRGAASVVFAGVVIGLALSALGAPLLGSLLYEAPRFDALAFVVVPIVVTLVATVSSLLPAIRAARVSPVQAMRAA